MLIAFTHTGKAFLPEIAAYRNFFERLGVSSMVVHPSKLHLLKPDVEWRFMGLQFRRSHAGILIHEYASASLPPARRWKDLIKSRCTIKPAFRLFLNDYVRDRYAFADGVPYGFRDMGIYPATAPHTVAAKEYDFIYCGSVSRDMQMEKLLDCFTGPGLQHKTLLVLSKDYQQLQQRYEAHTNILFKGPVPPEAVADYIRRSAFALNYKPDIAPHNRQTSTKFLEYAACGIPVITTHAAWVHDFQQRYGGAYFYLEPGLHNLTWENVTAFRYASPDLSQWTWEQQIRNSGVVEFLKVRFNLKI